MQVCKITILSLSVLLIGLTGCQSNTSRYENNDRARASSGAIVGSVIGAVIGARSGNVGKYAAIGAIIGGATGYIEPKIYRHFSRQDKAIHLSTKDYVLSTVPDGEGRAWSNPDTLISGHILVKTTYTNLYGTQCRLTDETIFYDTRQETQEIHYCWDENQHRYIESG